MDFQLLPLNCNEDVIHIPTNFMAQLVRWSWFKWRHSGFRRWMWFHCFSFLSPSCFNESVRNRSQMNHPAYFLKQIFMWWNSATADKVWAILGNVIQGYNASILFSFDKHRSLILDLVSSVRLFMFQRRSTCWKHGHRTHRLQGLSKYLPLTGYYWRKHTWYL